VLQCGAPAALRLGELVALEVGDLSFEPKGVALTIRRSKTDREGAGATVAVSLGAEEGAVRSARYAAGSNVRRSARGWPFAGSIGTETSG
jgi:hypothetical protein